MEHPPLKEISVDGKWAMVPEGFEESAAKLLRDNQDGSWSLWRDSLRAEALSKDPAT